MQLAFGSAALICMAVVLAVGATFRKLSAASKVLPVGIDWVSQASSTRYHPLQRLLQEDDYAFLSSQGCDRQVVRHLRSQRRKLFRRFLTSLTSDFGRVCCALRLLIVHSAQDRPDLAAMLYKQRILFVLGLVNVHWHLAMNACGLGCVDARGLLRVLENMRLQLGQLLPEAVAAAA
jgi:hypothetical protein